MILNLGCGERPLAIDGEIVNLDIRKTSITDQLWDIEVTPWPFDDETFEGVYALDILEHVVDFYGVVNECWRVLQPGGRLYVRGPLWGSDDHKIDPTHVRGFVEHSFDYLDPRTQFGQTYPHMTPYKWQLEDEVRQAGAMLYQLAKGGISEV